PLEEAAAYQQLIEDFGLTHEQLSARVGRSRVAITNTLRLFQLPPAVQRLLADGQLSAGHARALLATPDRAFQESLAKKAVAEQMSVRAVEEAVRARNELGGAPPELISEEPRRPRPAALVELEQLLSNRLDTRVRVDMTSRRGKVIIDFANLDDLERIYRAMTDGPAAPPADDGSM
ncbi:MAG TPA: ParB/RepB/Spo0J family partition protein, partial [Acidimicrobiales bacterium]|nr:ParB/RepB/Spo0J family partition protein [Acidimicrobiales bacterium]